VTGTFEVAVSSGTPPGRSVSARSYPFTAQVSGGRVLTIHIDGRTARGRLSGSRPASPLPSERGPGSATPGSDLPSTGLTIGPLPGSAAPLSFRAGTSGSFSRAVAALRDRVRRSDALARQAAGRVTLRRRHATQAAASLFTATRAVRQARRVISSRLTAMASVASLTAGALEKTRRDARKALAQARLGAGRVLVCDYAVAVDSDALGVSAYSAGLGADTASLREDMFALRTAISALTAQLRTVLRQQPGYRGGGLVPAPAQVRQQISRARQRRAMALAQANSNVDLINLDVARAYRLSARASNAGTCRSASGTPAPLPRMG
jgi:hypothetical protein